MAVRLLQHGGIVAYPTEAVYGLGCDPWNQAAVQAILRLKSRPWQKGLLLIAASFEQLSPFILPPPADILARILPTWPGPVTWLLPAAPGVPRWLRGNHATLAVRVTAHPVAAELCRAFGAPLVSTSANPADLPPARSLLKLRKYFAEFAENVLIVPGPLGGLKRPTPIHDPYRNQRLR
ncbi:MAG: L-threonylcarbamoyladenylate synthase [Methylohalobius sp. ZOD2]|nr:Sua5/YciO/YrdC/YwlC family protein [Methylothermaceae bacterium]